MRLELRERVAVATERNFRSGPEPNRPCNMDHCEDGAERTTHTQPLRLLRDPDNAFHVFKISLSLKYYYVPAFERTFKLRFLEPRTAVKSAGCSIFTLSERIMRSRERRGRTNLRAGSERAREGGQVSCRASTPILPPFLPSFLPQIMHRRRAVRGAWRGRP